MTNLEWDHPDVFADRRRRRSPPSTPGCDARRTERGRRLVLQANVGDPGVAELARAASRATGPGRLSVTALVDGETRRPATIARGLADEYAGRRGPAAVLLGRIAATDPDATTLELVSGRWLGDRRRAAPRPTAARRPAQRRQRARRRGGRRSALGVPADRLASGLASFAGVGRRLERKGEAGGVVVFDDYGHHPTAIRETLAAVRQRAPGRRVWAVYEPLTFHRTAALARRLRRGPRDRRRRRHRRHLGRTRSGHDDRVSAAGARARRWPARNPAIPVAAPGSVEATARWLAGRGPAAATPSS